MISLEKINKVLADYPSYRRAQVQKAIFGNLYDDWKQATNLPQDLKLVLGEESPLEIRAKLQKSQDGKTVKALVYLEDGKCIETVMMSLKDRHTICVSTQVGCPMGCTFCDSGRAGFMRNLTVSEIVGQIIYFARYLKSKDEHITNVVFMGMGEPFLNYENVIRSIRLLSEEETLGLSLRRFSISTAGVLPGIERLATEDNFPVNLAISLHSAIDKKRSSLMPINKKYPLKKLSKAVREYFDKTKRKVMYEYILLGGVNMGEEDAEALRDFVTLAGAAYCVNLIPINKTDCGYRPPSDKETKDFKELLDRYKIQYVQRYSFGRDIEAACGQLAKRENV